MARPLLYASARPKQELEDLEAGLPPAYLVDLLPARVSVLVTKWLPDDPDARREILLAIADWDEAVILEAATDSSYGLRLAVRDKDPGRLSAILAVAAKGVEFRRDRTALLR